METQTSELNILKPKDFKSFLQEELLKRCRKNPSYSLRSFAKYLGIGHSALTEMLNGKRSITKKSIEKLGLTLSLNMTEIE
ncbi:MAG: helix-turn-helix domain-containing protein, partial [Bacteriovorax sp.]|nr:helix-turn-helix domain-containing protein [Bacteriovorax sp.]